MLFGYFLHLLYIETQNYNVTMEAEIIAVYYAMSVNHSVKNLCYVRIAAAGSQLAILP